MEAPCWTEAEFPDLDLGDARLNKRARTLMERLAAKPTAGVPQACRSWGETIAAYRFFDNDEVEWEAILEPHWRQTERRMAAHPVVLCLQDTTELDFNARRVTGLGPLSYEARRGLYLHPTYAVSADRVGLGVLDAWMWAREPKDAQGKRGGMKESRRWIEGYERVAETASSLPHTRLVYVADREADMIALMVRAQELGTPADWLIRSTHDRALPEGAKLWATASEGEALGEIAFTMGSRHGVRARPVRQHVWLRRIELPAGDGRSVAAT
ncbi:IS4 family transposase, partial [Ralstonia solanacearum]|uniref:IS4 family transposase n=1 Tax=Ralstonia solanacearum TaxID=305 RepID=UPI0021750B87